MDFNGKIMVPYSAAFHASLEGERCFAARIDGRIAVHHGDFQGASAMLLVEDTPTNREESGGYYERIPPADGQGPWKWMWASSEELK